MYFKMYQASYLDVPAPGILLMYILLNEIITYLHPIKPFVLSANQKAEGKQEMSDYWKWLNKRNGASEYHTRI